MKSNLYQQLQSKIYWWLEKTIQNGSLELSDMQVAFGSSLGKRKNNQDRVVMYRVNFSETRKPTISGMILCDGMGGMLEGDDCANLAISSFLSSLVSATPVDLTEKLHQAALDANGDVYRKYRGKGGTTLSAISSDDAKFWTIVNVGDSRVYTLAVDGKVEQITADDTLERQLDDLKLPALPLDLMQLLQFIGMGEDITLSTVKVEISEHIRCLLMTSDGAHKIPDDLFTSILKNSVSNQDIVTRLITLSEWLGGKDNATVGVLPPTPNLLFNESESSPSGSLEIWSLSGKVEFFTVSTSSKEASSIRLQRSTENLMGIKGVAEKPVQSDTKGKKKPKKKINEELKSEEVQSSQDSASPVLDLQFDGEDIKW
jgi:PPM family protein phosphatase